MMGLQKNVKKAAELIKRHDYARVISHYDADGITAAGIISTALLRSGIQFHTTIVSKLDRAFIQGLDEELIIFCDMGTAQAELIQQYLSEREVIILDHHVPLAPLPDVHTASTVLINPLCANTTGKSKMDGELGEICAAGLSYLLARRMSGTEKDNLDLAGLAIAGTLGDKLPLTNGINKMIVDEALQEGIISVKKGLRLGDGKIRDAILFSTDPYIPLAGKLEWVDALLGKVGIAGDKKVRDLSVEEEKRLADALLSLLRKYNAEIHESALVGTTYRLNAEVIKNGLTFMRTVDACGRLGSPSIGIGLCLREEDLVEDATSLYLKFQSKLVSELNRLEREANSIKERQNLSYFFVQERGITGVLAGIIADYLYTGTIMVVVNTQERAEEGKTAETKISARCNKRLLAKSKGIDLAKAMEQASRAVGGMGGGHPVAAGASIPSGSEELFLAALDRILGEQRGRSQAPS
ncbi:MAG: DHH family phosphoesterase [Methanophagales archaeon ANME-1-THS]|nr:MAG: DHH family phosphoesterase [Methanophagales archaeon ANME-1-THS]